MLLTIEGVYKNGAVELKERPKALENGSPVIVTFLKSGKIDLQAHGIDRKQAAELRAKLASFAEEWDSPEMDAYDNYDANKANV